MFRLRGGRSMTMAATAAACSACLSSSRIRAEESNASAASAESTRLPARSKQMLPTTKIEFEKAPTAVAMSLKELLEGDGKIAHQGMRVRVQYIVRLLGDGSLIEDTQHSGWGNRAYGQPFEFTLGDIEDDAVLRALHACVLDMRVGGRRRVRTSILNPLFGYKTLPQVRDARWKVRSLERDWLIDVEVTLVATGGVERRWPWQ
mmetsp:Transcript_12173/g.26289  ORF Transcript_12173/g.26289 Transcript_12173/m.26289 type:complete len:204 (-) Transcript_12173:373-984(-)